MSTKRCAGGCGRSLPWHDDAHCEICAERRAASWSDRRPVDDIEEIEEKES